jgi:hypothetical protein
MFVREKTRNESKEVNFFLTSRILVQVRKNIAFFAIFWIFLTERSKITPSLLKEGLMT